MSNSNAALSPEKVMIRESHTTVGRLVEDYNNGTLIVDKGDAEKGWDDAARSRFIESLMVRLPISQVYVYSSNDGNWHVKDGRQRITALESFINGKFALEGLVYFPDFNGKHFDGMPVSMKRRIREADIKVVDIECSVPAEVVDDIISRIRG